MGEGELVDGGDALVAGELAGAALDVTEPEPLPADHKLLTLPNVIVTCHTAANSDESYIAPGYGLPSRAGQEAMHLLATTEAILTDHVYTAKALAALVADVRAGKYPRGSAVVFVHTGGVPAIFAEPDKVLPGM